MFSYCHPTVIYKGVTVTKLQILSLLSVFCIDININYWPDQRLDAANWTKKKTRQKQKTVEHLASRRGIIWSARVHTHTQSNSPIVFLGWLFVCKTKLIRTFTHRHVNHWAMLTRLFWRGEVAPGGFLYLFHTPMAGLSRSPAVQQDWTCRTDSITHEDNGTLQASWTVCSSNIYIDKPDTAYQ